METWVYVFVALAYLLLYVLADPIPAQWVDPDLPFLDYLENTNPALVNITTTIKYGTLEYLEFKISDLFDSEFRRERGLRDPRSSNSSNANATGSSSSDSANSTTNSSNPPKTIHRRNKKGYKWPFPFTYKEHKIDLFRYSQAFHFLPATRECWRGNDTRANTNANLGGAYLCRDYLDLVNKTNCIADSKYEPADVWCNVTYEGVRTVVRGYAAPKVHGIAPEKIVQQCNRAAGGLSMLLDSCPFADECHHRLCPFGGVTMMKGDDRVVMVIMND